MTENDSWADAPWVGFDTETTGVSPKRDRIVTAATVLRSGGAGAPGAGAPRAGTPRAGALGEGAPGAGAPAAGALGAGAPGAGSVSAGRPSADTGEGIPGATRSADKVTTWLANPGVPIPASAARIHGVTTQYAAKHGADPKVVVEEIDTYLADSLKEGDTIVVFNAGFDLPLLENESVRHGVTPLRERVEESSMYVADPLVLDRALDRYRKGKRTLSDLATVYGVAVPEDTHQAHVDATLALNLLQAMVVKYPQLRSMGRAELHSFQEEAHRTWAVGFQEFMRAKGRDVRINPNWF